MLMVILTPLEKKWCDQYLQTGVSGYVLSLLIFVVSLVLENIVISTSDLQAAGGCARSARSVALG
jgi:hypothetical protein